MAHFRILPSLLCFMLLCLLEMQMQSLKRSNSSSCLLTFCCSSWPLPVEPRCPSFALALLSLRVAYYQRCMLEEQSTKVRTMVGRTYQSVYEYHKGSGGVSLAGSLAQVTELLTRYQYLPLLG